MMHWNDFFVLLVGAVAAACGRLYERSKRIEYWRQGFEEARKIYRPDQPS